MTTENVLSDLACFSLAEQAEQVRWRWEQVPWPALRPDLADDALKARVALMASSELTTFTASKKFLQEFSDDLDFSTWISTWFYEESRHPQVLLRWLERLGHTVDQAWMRRGRLATPFMKSPFGTLVNNVISETVAASNYVSLAQSTEEPALRWICRSIAADEARHAAVFSHFARSHLQRSRDPREDKRLALKLLHLWTHEAAQHPVALYAAREELSRDDAPPAETVRERVRRVVGALIEQPLASEDAVERLLHARGEDGQGEAPR